MKSDRCIRDWAGFCLLALWGWPKCFWGAEFDQCVERDPQGNLEAARQRAIKSHSHKTADASAKGSEK